MDLGKVLKGCDDDGLRHFDMKCHLQTIPKSDLLVYSFKRFQVLNFRKAIFLLSSS